MGFRGVAAFGIFSYSYSAGFVDRGAAGTGLLNASSGFVFALWMVLALYLSVRLILSGPFRDQVMARITFIRERDEREALLTGKATRTTFLMTIALLIFLFVLSCFQVSVYRVPPDKAVDGKTGMITLGLGFSLLEQGSQSVRKSRRKAGHLHLPWASPVQCLDHSPSDPVAGCRLQLYDATADEMTSLNGDTVRVFPATRRNLSLL